VNLWTYNQYEFEEIQAHKEPFIIISIRTPGAEPMRTPQGPNVRGVLLMAFPDLDNNYKALPAEYRNEYTDDELFNAKHAKEILTFVAQHKEGVESIIIQCEGGLSRSRAVKAALDKLLNGNDAPYDGTNDLVYETILETAIRG